MAKAIAKRPQSAAGGTVGSKGGPGMAAIFGPGGPIILPWTVRGDHFRGGTVHGMTGVLVSPDYSIISSRCPLNTIQEYFCLLSYCTGC